MKKLTLLLLIAFSAFQFSFIADQPTGYKVGDMAKDFKLKNVDGKLMSLSNFTDAKGFIVVFTCNHCPFSQAYEQRIINLHKKYNPKGYPVIAINPNDKDREPEDSYENMQKRAKEKKYPFVYLYDETQVTAKIYGAARTPHIYILKKTAKGNVVEYIGSIDDNFEEPEQVKQKYAEDALNAMLAEKPISTTSTKAIGCTIKWKK
jgi:glutathione peroxidase-family protein